jgi:hypothetical protein
MNHRSSWTFVGAAIMWVSSVFVPKESERVYSNMDPWTHYGRTDLLSSLLFSFGSWRGMEWSVESVMPVCTLHGRGTVHGCAYALLVLARC